MSKKVSFSIEVVEQFHKMDTPLTQEEKMGKIKDLEKKYGGEVKLIEHSTYFYTAYSTKDGE